MNQALVAVSRSGVYVWRPYRQHFDMTDVNGWGFTPSSIRIARSSKTSFWEGAAHALRKQNPVQEDGGCTPFLFSSARIASQRTRQTVDGRRTARRRMSERVERNRRLSEHRRAYDG